MGITASLTLTTGMPAAFAVSTAGCRLASVCGENSSASKPWEIRVSAIDELAQLVALALRRLIDRPSTPASSASAL